MKLSHSEKTCRRQAFQLNRLHPEHDWGQLPVGAAFNLINTFVGIAGRLDFDAWCLRGDARYKEALGEDLQAGQCLRAAAQLNAQAARLRREAGTAAWPNAFGPTVDMVDARPVAAQ